MIRHHQSLHYHYIILPTNKKLFATPPSARQIKIPQILDHSYFVFSGFSSYNFCCCYKDRIWGKNPIYNFFLFCKEILLIYNKISIIINMGIYCPADEGGNCRRCENSHESPTTQMKMSKVFSFLSRWRPLTFKLDWTLWKTE